MAVAVILKNYKGEINFPAGTFFPELYRRENKFSRTFLLQELQGSD